MKIFLKIRYEAYTGKKLNLINPIEINEKKNWLKLYYHPSILTQLADKYSVRKYVSEKIGSQYLNELFGYFNDVNSINFDQLPNKFIAKAVHGSHKNLIVKDKSKLDLIQTKKLFSKWLKYSQYKKVGFEWAYKNIKSGIIFEKLMVEKEKLFLTDYKFYCFHGKVKYIQLDSEFEGKKQQAYLDINFEPLNFRMKNEDWFRGSLQKPKKLSKMIELAEKLADKFPYVRIDFYYIEENIIFGEITFYPGDGKHEFYPDEYNKIIGSYLTLPKLEKGQNEITNY